MLVMLAFGGLLVCFSCIMIVSPNYWSTAIISFSQKTGFHVIEIVSRLAAGSAFLYCRQQSPWTNLMLCLGCLLIVVAIGLVMLGPVKHRQFAVWSAKRFKGIFRPAGVLSLFFALFLIYTAISGNA